MKISYENGEPVSTINFDYDAIDRGNQLTAEMERSDRESAKDYYREKIAEMMGFILDAIISDQATAEKAGRRAYFIALFLRRPPFQTQAELASHLGISKVAICQQLNAFAQENPLFAELLCCHNAKQINTTPILE